MGAQIIGGPSGLPSANLLDSAIRSLSRDALEDLCEQLIDRLDAMDPNADLEPNGDELDGSMGEDDFYNHNVPLHLDGPGCPIADPDTAVDDTACDGETDTEPLDHSEQPCRYDVDQRMVMPRHPMARGVAHRHD